MKLLNCLAAAVLCLTFDAMCGDKSVSNKDVGFDVTFPDGWTVTEPPMGEVAQKVGIVYGEAPKVGERPAARVNLTVSVLNADAKLATYFDDYRATEKKIATRQPFRELVEKKELKVGGVDAYKLTYSTDEQVGLVWIEYLFVSGRRQCIIQFNIEKSDVDKVSKDVDAIVKSFKLTEVK